MGVIDPKIPGVHKSKPKYILLLVFVFFIHTTHMTVWVVQLITMR